MVNGGARRTAGAARFRVLRSLSLAGILALAACASPAPPTQPQEAPVGVADAQKDLARQAPSERVLKRKIAIGRFTNETLYGRALLSGRQLDAMGRQVGDVLSSRLVETGKFIVLERPDLETIEGERRLSGISGNLPGANALIVGSLTEFGRKTEGQSGFFSRTKKQVASAKVNLRLVDPRTTAAVFSASGAGQATTEAGTTLGFGSKAGYDETLNDRAIAAAIADVMNELVTKLEDKPWWTDILDVQDGQVVISGGQKQGLAPGQVLDVMQRGRTITSRQTGFPIELPGTKVATIKIVETFGNDVTDEGSVAVLAGGTLPSEDLENYYVAEPKGAE